MSAGLLVVLAVCAGEARAAPVAGCAAGALDACAEEGAVLVSAGRWTEAERLLRTACDAGGGSACYTLGSAHARGAGPPRDLGRAAGIFERACELGYTRACGDLGWMHAEALGVERDEVRARAWMGRACDGGEARACGELSVLLRDGRGGASDPVAAEARAEQGCRGSDGPSCVHAATRAEARGDASGAYRLAVAGCELGEGRACAMAGVALQRGHGVAPSPVEGLARLEASCAAGYGPGCTAGGLLGVDLAAREGTADRDAATRAVALLQRGCALGERHACEVLEAAAGPPDPAPAEPVPVDP